MTDVDPSAAHLQHAVPVGIGITQESGTISIDGDVLVGAGLLQHVIKATVARTDASAKTLGTLPAGAVITGITIYGATASDAGTSAVLDVGKGGGNGHEYLHSFDVQGSTGAGQQNPTGAVLGSVGASAVTVTGTYTESGTAATTGGPWTVIIRFTTS